MPELPEVETTRTGLAPHLEGRQVRSVLMRRPDLGEEEKACCPRCGYELVVHRSQMERRALALVLTALLLFVPANFLPIMKLNLLGQTTHDTVWTGVVGLYDTGMEGVAVLVFLCSMVIPLVKLLCQLASHSGLVGVTPAAKKLGQSWALNRLYEWERYSDQYNDGCGPDEPRRCCCGKRALCQATSDSPVAGVNPPAR